MKRARMDYEDGPQNSSDQQNWQTTQENDGPSSETNNTQRGLPWVVNSQNTSRYFCPVGDCPYADVVQAKGWASLQGVRYHLREHTAGRFSGAIPQAFLNVHNLCSCSVCGKIISTRNNGCCPSCRPKRRNAASSGPTDASATSDLPSMDDICSTKARLLKYIPRGARPIWGQALAQTAAATVWHNSEQAWTEWAMLPKCVLFAPPRQGKSNKSNTLAFIKNRCERWLEGERMELWLDGPGMRLRRRNTKASKTSNQPDTDTEQRQQRCLELAADGQYSKAAKALVNPRPLERNEATEKSLQEKHPLAQSEVDLTDLAAPDRAQVPEFDGTQVKKMLKSFSRGTAPGPSGLRAQHLKDAIRSAHGDEATEQITSICNILARGDAPENISQYLAGATLMALEKPGGGIRPIAIGEVIRRLVSKCFCKYFEKDANAYLWPRQIGVAAPLGAEVGSQTVC